tara:strand:+ start:614 stop:1213 length:600 start_codon:yes stop_codon:yes gene_type:complete
MIFNINNHYIKLNMQKIIIYNFKELFKILDEVKDILYFKIEHYSSKDKNKLITVNNSNDIVISNKVIDNHQNSLILNDLPIKISKLIEIINLELIKKKFSNQSEIKFGEYKINLNSRELILTKTSLKLTEKEINIILYLLRANKPVNIKELQTAIWAYNQGTETHTVETHIYRLRKKILKLFNDKNFIDSVENGYILNV